MTPAAASSGRGRGLPALSPGELNAGSLRAAVLSRGCLLIRGLIEAEQARLPGARRSTAPSPPARRSGRGQAPEGYYEELEPDPPYLVGERSWVARRRGARGRLAEAAVRDALAPSNGAGLPQVIASTWARMRRFRLQKSTLRKASPATPGAWHQDGRFLSEVRAMNVWLSLSHCGDTAPGLDLVPRRLEDFVATGTEGAFLETQVSAAVAEEAAGDAGILRPIFEPGDALLFDEMFLHQTGSDPSMPERPLRDRELVLRAVELPRRIRAPRRLTREAAPGAPP